MSVPSDQTRLVAHDVAAEYDPNTNGLRSYRRPRLARLLYASVPRPLHPATPRQRALYGCVRPGVDQQGCPMFLFQRVDHEAQQVECARPSFLPLATVNERVQSIITD